MLDTSLFFDTLSNMAKKPFRLRVEDADEHHAFITLNGNDVVVMRPIVSDDAFRNDPEITKKHPLTQNQWQKILDFFAEACNKKST